MHKPPLRTQGEIIQSWDPFESPMVSISCITYNHEPYIRDAIEGFLRQETDFSFEILIHDDASTDGTEEIIRKYEDRYPEIIKPLYEEENQWVKGRRGSAVFNFPRARGKYIALCEGDDYWTDPLKLQKQVDFLEGNPDYSMCSHEVKTIYEGVEEKYPFKDPLETATFEDIITHGHFIPTLSICFKRSALPQIPWWLSKLWVGDIPLHLLVTHYGQNYHMQDVMGVKRKNPGGVTQNPDHKKDPSWVTRNKLFFYRQLNAFTDYQHRAVLEPLIADFALKNLRIAFRERRFYEMLKLILLSLKYPRLFIKMLQTKLFGLHK